jgi:pantoate--beta-alanine ligase
MLIFKKAIDINQFVLKQKESLQTIGFVPTMGALHQGHISLIQTSKIKTNITICSIFVNPTQFNNKEDFEKYPITIEEDIYLLEQAKCDVLFLPSCEEMYPNGLKELKSFNLGFIETVFEGEKRPSHFNGVCTIVEKLLNMVQPNTLFLGQKDYQQCIVIAKLIGIMNKQNEMLLEICQTAREENGLALSSRNKRLSNAEKNNAKIVYQSFIQIKKNITYANCEEILADARSNILNNGFDEIDYLNLANANTLEPLNQFDPSIKTVILFAGFIDKVRLIDNMLLN